MAKEFVLFPLTNKTMNLYLIEQSTNNEYDTYSDAVVAAKTPKEAKNTHPNNSGNPLTHEDYGTWVDSADLVTAKLIGKAAKGIKAGVICASFHAG